DARALAICLELQADAGSYADVDARVERLAKAQARGEHSGSPPRLRRLFFPSPPAAPRPALVHLLVAPLLRGQLAAAAGVPPEPLRARRGDRARPGEPVRRVRRSLGDLRGAAGRPRSAGNLGAAVTLCLVTDRRRFDPPVPGLLAQIHAAVAAGVDL